MSKVELNAQAETIEASSAATPSEWLAGPAVVVMAWDWEKIAYAGIFLLAVISRFVGLGDQVVSHDESLHTQYSFQYFNGDGYTHTPLMHGPFLFHVTALSYWLFGHNDLTARIPVAIFGVILVMMPYFLRPWIGKKGALTAGFLFLISPYTVYYSRYIRHDVYVIVWALIVFMATWYYFRDRNEKSLWWFAFGLALMFATKEVSFIYVAIFGSFLLLRLGGKMIRSPWFKNSWPRLRTPFIVMVLGGLLLGGGLVGKSRVETAETGATMAEAGDPVAADPSADLGVAAESGGTAETTMRWLQVLGIVVASTGLFMAGSNLRPYLEEMPEFDLVVLYVTLLLPSTIPLLSVIMGWNPLDYNMNVCTVPGQEAMNSFQLFMARLGTVDCWEIFFTSGIVRTGLFLIPALVVTVLIGMWWHPRRWITAALIFHVTFTLLYTSMFTNLPGWTSGTIGSLGYWLEQQEVQRGSQPYFYYAVVMPLYEFLPLIFSFAAMRLWAIRKRVFPLIRFWTWTFTAALIGYGLANWAYFEAYDNLPELAIESAVWPGALTAGSIIFAAAAYWLLRGSRSAKERLGLSGWATAMPLEEWLGFVPSLIWWLFLTAVAYTAAGEKMPWLSIHFVIPMAFLVGWYFQTRLDAIKTVDLKTQSFWALTGLTAVFIVAVFMAVGPLILGEVQFGMQVAGQSGAGRFVGGLIVAVGLGYFIYQYSDRVRESVRPLAWTFAVFGVLALLTMRFAYMAAIPNADLPTEYLVYAHGGPATKAAVMSQLEELSQRQYGDMSLQVAYDNETSWPYTWYLRVFPNRAYFGESPSPDISDKDAVLVGDTNYSKVEPFLGDDFDYQEFVYLWWPMEDYRRISWGAIIGDLDADPAVRRGIGNAQVRQGLWDIFFYRDYEVFGQAMGNNYNLGSWPLRRTMRLYIRRDVKSLLWDRGAGAAAVVPPVDPYAGGELPFEPTAVIGSGDLNRPRNAAVGPDGVLYVADSGNHVIRKYAPDGSLLDTFGEFGEGEGQFNEPWSVAADAQFIYVADTWNYRVQKLTHDGEFVAQIGRSGTVENASDGPGLFFGPRDVVLVGDDRLLVTDTGNHRVQLFTRDGEFVSALGGLGSGLGQFYEPVGAASSPVSGRIFLADTWNERVQILAAEPDLFATGSWEVAAWDNSQSIDNKPYLAIDGGGRIYATDPEGYRVLIFDEAGQYLGRFGTFSNGADGFGLPNGITVDEENNVYVVDAANGHVLKFAPPLGR